MLVTIYLASSAALCWQRMRREELKLDALEHLGTNTADGASEISGEAIRIVLHDIAADGAAPAISLAFVGNTLLRWSAFGCILGDE